MSTTAKAPTIPRAIFLPRLFLRAALARARLSLAAKLREWLSGATGLGVAEKPVPSKADRVRLRPALLP